jgi:hypothetical protein
MPNLELELEAVRDVVSLTGFKIANIRPAYPELGSAERGLDTLFDLDGRRVGAQHTTFHLDEGHTPGERGSPTRAKEERIARTSQTPFGLWGKFDYRPALRLRIDEKIAKAAAYNNRHLIAEIWLVISANVSKWGAAASTMIAANVLCAGDLNALCHAQLDASEFECACLVLHMDRIVWGWDRPGRWRVLADPGAREREQHRKEMNDLIFNQIPAHFREASRTSEESQAAMSHTVNWIDRTTGEARTHVVRGVGDTDRHAMIFACSVIKSQTRPLDVWVADEYSSRIADWKTISDFGNANGYV